MSGRLETIFREHYAWLRDTLRQRTQSVHGAEDAASEAFVQLAVYRGLEDVREPRALLTTIAKRILFNTWRRRDLELAYLAALASMPPSSHPSPEERLMHIEALLSIDLALKSLPPKASQAFLRCQLDGMTYSEVAHELGVSASMVRQYMALSFAAIVMSTP